MALTRLIKYCTLLTFLATSFGMVMPNATRQVTQRKFAGITFGSARLTPFVQVEGFVRRRSDQGSFAVNRLMLLKSRNPNTRIALGFYAIQLTRQPAGRFFDNVLTPRNSDATLQFLSDNGAVRMRLEVQSNVGRRSTFVYEGTVNVVSGASPTAATLELGQVTSITFESAEESSRGGTFGQVAIARRTTSPRSSANLLQLRSQPIPLSTFPPSPLASSFLPGRVPIQAADNNQFTFFQSFREQNPYFTIATVSGRTPIEFISVTATNANTFRLSGVRVFVGDCVLESGPKSQIVRYLNDPASASQLQSCARTVGVRRAFECEPVQAIRGFPRETIDFYCGASRDSWGFLYVTTDPGVTANKELGITEIAASRNA